MSKKIAAFYNNSDTNIKLVKYDANVTPPVIAAEDVIPKGTRFKPSQQYNVPDCYPIDKWFSQHRIDIRSEEKVLLSFWDIDPDGSQSNYDLYYCNYGSGVTPPPPTPTDYSVMVGNSSVPGAMSVYFVLSGSLSSNSLVITAYPLPQSMSDSNYTFDIVFKSDITPMAKPADLKQPIAMAFGYGFTPTGLPASEIGQKTKEKIFKNGNIAFRLYDLATTKKEVEKVVISFIDEKGNRSAPFSNWTNGEMTFSGTQLVAVENVQSVGCNLISAYAYGLGGDPSQSFTAENPGKYEFTVMVYLKGEDRTVFRADPEMDVASE